MDDILVYFFPQLAKGLKLTFDSSFSPNTGYVSICPLDQAYVMKKC